MALQRKVARRAYEAHEIGVISSQPCDVLPRQVKVLQVVANAVPSGTPVDTDNMQVELQIKQRVTQAEKRSRTVNIGELLR